MSQGQ
jgi:succinate dehydrogenase/fumarate reductase-like Fe-S protein